MEFSTSPIRHRRSVLDTAMTLPGRALRFVQAHKVATAIVVVLVLSFYWFQVRPIRIARSCALQASFDAKQLLRSRADVSKDKEKKASYMALVEKNMYLRTDYESFFQKCLLYYGMGLTKISDTTEVSN